MTTQNLINTSLINNYEKILFLITRDSKDINLDLCIHDKSCSILESEIIFAILNGYLQDKEILNYLNQFKYIKYSSVRYNVKKLLIKFNTSSRSELFRKLLVSKYLYFVPKSIYQKLKPPPH